MLEICRRKIFFTPGIIVAASGLIGPPLALLAGLVFGLSVEHPLPGESRNLSKFLLQAAVVCLGFGMDLKEVVQRGRRDLCTRHQHYVALRWDCGWARC